LSKGVVEMIQDRIYEEILLNQWQPLQTMLYDGWVLRFANGYTKRANSVNPIYFSTIDVVDKINHCERIYASHRLKTTFKITPFIQPKNLDEILNHEGYSTIDHTSVQRIDLKQLEQPNNQRVHIDDRVNEEWLHHFCVLNEVNNKHKETMKLMLSNQLSEKGFFTLFDNDDVVACGLGMIERNALGIFDIVTNKNYRNLGWGEQLMLHILQWGRNGGADYSYLAVLLHNQPALKLYSKVGYKEIYKYWYRVK
jgi:ribosomal protein S18 acetylase RimI-like enzyme